MAEPARSPEEQRQAPPVHEVRREPVAGVAPVVPVGLIRWRPVAAGVATLFGVLIFLSALGTALGLSGTLAQTGSPDTAALIWGAASVFIAYLVGGWVAARAAWAGGSGAALLNGATVWASSLLLVLLLVGLNLAGLLGLLGFGLAAIGLRIAPVPAISPQAAQFAAWTTVGAMALTLLAAMVGGLLGSHPAPEERVVGR